MGVFMIREGVFDFLGVTLLGLMAYLLVVRTDGLAGAGLSFLAAADCFVVANLDRIVRFKISPGSFEAETRIIKEAKDTLVELRALASVVVTTTLSLVKRSGRIGGYNDVEEQRIRDELLALLRRLGVKEVDIQAALSEWHRFVEFDYVGWILNSYTLPRWLPTAEVERWHELSSGGIQHIASPDQLEQFYDNYGRLTPEIRELIADYRYYIEHRKHRRPAVWAKRGELRHIASDDQ